MTEHQDRIDVLRARARTVLAGGGLPTGDALAGMPDATRRQLDAAAATIAHARELAGAVLAETDGTGSVRPGDIEIGPDTPIADLRAVAAAYRPITGIAYIPFARLFLQALSALIAVREREGS